MASVTFSPVIIPTPPPEDVHLHLTAEEAEILSRVLDRVGGGEGGPRGKMDNITIALSEAGIKKANIDIKGATYIWPS